MSKLLSALAFTVVTGCLGAIVAHAECPPPSSILATLDELDLAAAARTRAFDLQPPKTLYERATDKPGKVIVKNDGKLGQAILLTDLPIEALWMAVNDEDHYAQDGYLPVLHSEVIGGTPRGEERVIFQYFKRAGVGRWWVDRVEMSQELFLESDTMLWELRWWDLMETRTLESLPVDRAQELTRLGLSPIRASRGAWLMIPLDTECTLVEYVTYSDAGGYLSFAQILGAGRVIRDTLEGIQRLAREHIPEPHADARFVRPDGIAIDAP
jgi:hypothetical protein